MKMWSFLLLIALLVLTSCTESDDVPVLQLQDYIDAEIYGIDETLWACGGGWLMGTDVDTVQVHAIPNQEVLAVLASSNFTGDPPLRVSVLFNPEPSTACASQFGFIRELLDIQLR